MSTRLGWSAFGSVQSDPYRWGRRRCPATRRPPAARTVAPPPNVSHPNLNGAESPQTIYGVGAQRRADLRPRPGPPRSRSAAWSSTGTGAEVALTATGAGTARVYLWSGDQGQIPVFTTTCDEPAPDFGLTACGTSDGGIPPWSPDQSGRVVAAKAADLTPGAQTMTIDLTAAQRDRLRHDGSALISYETPDDAVQAFDVPLARPQMWLTATRAGARTGSGSGSRRSSAARSRSRARPSGNVQFQLDGVNAGEPVALGGDGRAQLTIADPGEGAAHTFGAVYDGDWDYASATATLTRARRRRPRPARAARPGRPARAAAPPSCSCRAGSAARSTIKCRIAPQGSRARTRTTIRYRGRVGRPARQRARTRSRCR